MCLINYKISTQKNNKNKNLLYSDCKLTTAKFPFMEYVYIDTSY